MTSTEALNITGSINTDLMSEKKARLRDTQIGFCFSSSFCRIPTKFPRNLVEIYMGYAKAKLFQSKEDS